MINLLDLGICLLLLLGIGYGVYRGLLKELISFLILIIAYFMANFHYLLLSGLFSRYLFKDELTANLSGFLSLFILSLGLLIYLVKIIQYSSKITLPSTIFNRIAAGLLGMIKGILMISLLLMPFELYPSLSLEKGLIKESLLIPYFRQSTKLLYRLSFSKLQKFSAGLPETRLEEISESEKEGLQQILKKELQR